MNINELQQACIISQRIHDLQTSNCVWPFAKGSLLKAVYSPDCSLVPRPSPRARKIFARAGKAWVRGYPGCRSSGFLSHTPTAHPVSTFTPNRQHIPLHSQPLPQPVGNNFSLQDSPTGNLRALKVTAPRSFAASTWYSSILPCCDYQHDIAVSCLAYNIQLQNKTTSSSVLARKKWVRLQRTQSYRHT